MKRTILTALALSGALALGACGSTDTGAGSGTSQEAPAASAAKVGDTVDLAELATKSSAAVKDKGTAVVTTEMGGDGTMEGGVDFGGKSPAMSLNLTLESGNQSTQVVLLDGVMYMGGDDYVELTGGKRWIKIDPEGKDMMSQMAGPMLEQMGSAFGNPAEALKAYEGAKGTVTKVEDGAVTYSVKLTKEQLAAGVKAQAAGIPGITDKALEQLPDGVTYEMKLSDEYLPMTLQTDLGKGDKMTMIYSRWGEPVDIKAPAASEVGTFQMPTG